MEELVFIICSSSLHPPPVASTELMYWIAMHYYTLFIFCAADFDNSKVTAQLGEIIAAALVLLVRGLNA